MAAPVTCTPKNPGTFDAADQKVLLDGWHAYSSMADKSNGPYLKGNSETVFQTNQFTWSEWGTLKQGHS